MVLLNIIQLHHLLSVVSQSCQSRFLIDFLDMHLAECPNAVLITSRSATCPMESALKLEKLRWMTWFNPEMLRNINRTRLLWEWPCAVFAADIQTSTSEDLETHLDHIVAMRGFVRKSIILVMANESTSPVLERRFRGISGVALYFPESSALVRRMSPSTTWVRTTPSVTEGFLWNETFNLVNYTFIVEYCPNDPPYSMNNTDGRLSGYDHMFLRNFSNFYPGMKLKMVKGTLRSWKYGNIPKKGMMGNVYAGMADGATCDLHYTSERSLNFEQIPIRTEGITIVVPKPTYKAARSQLFSPFTLQLWIGVVVSFGVTVLLLALFYCFCSSDARKKNFRTGLRESLWDNFSLLASQPMRYYVSKNRGVRAYLGVCLFATLVLLTAYHSRLRMLMIKPRLADPVKDTKGLVASSLRLSALYYDGFWARLMVNPELPLSHFLNRMTNVSNVTEGLNGVLSGKYAFLETEPIVDYHIALNHGRFMIRGLSRYHKLNKVYFNFATLVVKKHTFYGQILMDFAKSVRRSGLDTVWLRNILEDAYQQGANSTIKKEKDEVENGKTEPERLALRHVYPVLIFYYTGIGCAILVFLLELFLSREWKKRETGRRAALAWN